MASNSTTLNVRVLVDAAQAAAGLNQLSGHVDQTASKMSTAMKAGALAAGAAIVAFAVAAVESLARIETINAQTEAAIKSTGGAANVTGSHVEELAGHIENLTATEAETVQQGANLLLTFTNIRNGLGAGNDIFDQSTAIMTDMARALGEDVPAAAMQLGKALQDPVAGLTALQRVGVKFTADQKDMITSMVAAGDVMGAQKIILGELNREFGGSGAAYAQTAAGQWDLFKDALGTFGETVMGIVMPAFTPLLGALQGVLGWVTQLPGPVLAAGAAFAGWVIITALTASMGGLVGAISLIPTALGLAGLAVKGFFVSIGPVGWALIGLTAAVAIFYAMMGDDTAPAVQEVNSNMETWIGTLDKATGAITQTTRAQVAADLANDGTLKMLSDLGISTSDYVDATVGVAGASDRLAAQVPQATRTLWDQNTELQKLVEMAGKAGISQTELMSASSSGDWSGITAKVSEYVKQLAMTDSTGAADFQQRFNAQIAAGQNPLNALTNAISQATVNAQGLALGTADAQAALSAAGTSADQYATALADIKAAAKAAAGATELQTSLDTVKTAADNAGRAMDYINGEIDKYTGRNASLDDATVAYAALFQGPAPDQTTAWQDFITVVGDQGVTALNNFDTAYLGGTAAGKAMYDQLRGMKSGYDDLNSAAYESALATGGTEAAIAALGTTSASSRASFITWAQPLADAGVDVQALADKLGILDLTTLQPKFLEVITNDQNAQAALVQLEGLQIDPKTILITEDDLATPAVDRTVTYVDSVTHETRTIPLAADATTATQVTNTIIADMNSRRPSPIPITADPAPANQTTAGVVSNVQSQHPILTIGGNTGPADTSVGIQVGNVNGRRDAAISIGADTSIAQGAVSALIRDVSLRSATLTVNVVANTTSFMNSFNSLPSSKPVAGGAHGGATGDYGAFGVDSQPYLLARGEHILDAGDVAAMGGQQAVYAFRRSLGAAAGPMVNAYDFEPQGFSSGSGTTAVVNTYNYSIQVDGALDPDATARQIRDILQRQDRRAGVR